MLALSRTPDGDRLRVEGNLISALYGRDAAAGTLDADDVPAAVAAFLGRAEQAAGVTLPAAGEWDLHRLDPSRTIQLPAGLTAQEVVTTAAAGWMLLPGRNVAVHNRETATRVITKWRSHSVYDKTADARRKGQDVPAGLLRLEARLRPRSAKSASFVNFRPTLDLTPSDMETIMRELDLLAQSINAVSAASDLALVQALVKAGATHNEAVRISTVTRLVSVYGTGILASLGVPERTAARWVSEVRHWQGRVSETDLEETASFLLLSAATVGARDVAGAPESDPGAAGGGPGARSGERRRDVPPAGQS